MKQPVVMLIVCLLTTGAAASPGTKDIIHRPAAPWVLSNPEPTKGTAPPDAPLRIIYNDQQVRMEPSGQESYYAYRLRILKPEALTAGNINLAWDPSNGSATVHSLRIIRGDQTIDILKSQKFKVIQREGGLEQSILDGQLTAMLQVPGLQIGDELEMAFTIAWHDPVLGDHAFGLGQMPVQGMPGAFRFRLTWPENRQLTWRATRDLPQAVPLHLAGQQSVTYELRDPVGVIVNSGAPPRYNIRRLVEYSDFASWKDVSQRFFPLFDQSATLSPTSPLQVESAKIAAASSDPTERTQAALRLVQDNIRYVYVGLDGGHYRPATADETWRRRFGDCKAKTVILLSLLRALNIEAEPVLVNLLGGGDGTEARLPSPSVFNHVLVRARIGGKAYWLDGTRTGDHFLDRIPAPTFRWILPLRAAGGDLEAVAPTPHALPQTISVVDIDASAGFNRPARIKAQSVMRYDDDAFAIRNQLAAMSSSDATRALREYWRAQIDWVEPDDLSWRYDERDATLILSLDGTGTMAWRGDDEDGHRYILPGAGFYQPDTRMRPKEQDQSAPWAIEFPRYRCFATSIRLPPANARWAWNLYADPIDQTLGGIAYWRISGMKGNIARTVMSSRALAPEIDAAEAQQVNAAIPGFNDNMSSVYQVTPPRGPQKPDRDLPFGDAVDWSGNVPMCRSPERH